MKIRVALFAALLPLVGASAQSRVLVVSGIGGEPRYSDLFFELGKTFVQSAVERHGVGASDIVFLAEDPSRDPQLVAGQSTRENVEVELGKMATAVRPGDHVIVVLIGLGSSQGAEGKFNLPGPDLGALDFKRMLEPFAEQQVAFINMSTGSGDFVQVLSAPNRVVITATKTGFERNESHFMKYFVESYSKDVADADKDGRVSLFEAFEYARIEVKRFYDDDGRLMTEHALIDDNADGTGTHIPDLRADGADGSMARYFFITGPVAASVAAKNPALAALLAEKASIEKSIEALKRIKDTMDAASYDAQLEKLILDLALKTRQIRELGGGLLEQ